MIDPIDRQAAIDALSYCQTYLFDSRDHDKKISLEDAEYAIEQLPPAQPERPKGHWLPDNNYVYETRFVCSVCKNSEAVPTIGFTKYKPIWDFCPNCGADMRSEQNEH